MSRKTTKKRIRACTNGLRKAQPFNRWIEWPLLALQIACITYYVPGSIAQLGQFWEKIAWLGPWDPVCIPKLGWDVVPIACGHIVVPDMFQHCHIKHEKSDLCKIKLSLHDTKSHKTIHSKLKCSNLNSKMELRSQLWPSSVTMHCPKLTDIWYCPKSVPINILSPIFYLKRSSPTYALEFFDRVVCSTLTCNQTKMLFK